MLGRVANFVLKSLAQRISIIWDKLLDKPSQGFLLQSFEPQIVGCVIIAPSGVGIDDGARLPADLSRFV